MIEGAVTTLRAGGIDAFGTTCDVRDAKRCADAVSLFANCGKLVPQRAAINGWITQCAAL